MADSTPPEEGAPTKAFVSGVESGNIATFTVAGATLILADFTALLAWFTWESIRATRREANIAEQALAAARRHADIADESLKGSSGCSLGSRCHPAPNRRPVLHRGFFSQLREEWLERYSALCSVFPGPGLAERPAGTGSPGGSHRFCRDRGNGWRVPSYSRRAPLSD